MLKMRVMGTKSLIEGVLGPELCEHVKVQGGDTTLTCEPEVKTAPKKEESARVNEAFDKLIAANYLAYDVTREKRIEKYDPSAEELILAPPMAGGC